MTPDEEYERRRTLDALRRIGGPARLDEIIGRAGLGGATVRQVLDDLIDSREVERTGQFDDLYQLRTPPTLPPGPSYASPL